MFRPTAKVTREWPHLVYHKATQATPSDLLTGPSIVDADTRHSSTLVPLRAGLTVEARHGVDAAGAREAGVRVSTLGTK